MAGSPQFKAQLGRLGGRSLAGLIRLVERTSRRICDPPDLDVKLYLDNPVIVACWHGQFMMLSGLKSHPDYKVAAMVARHGDAELIGEAMRRFDVELIRGAGAGGRRKDRGGASALRASIRALNDGRSLVMTADVPPGPARRAGAGIITIARMSGVPIYPIAAATSRFMALDTWSRLTINLPFSKLIYASGTPIEVPRDADEAEMERCRLMLEAELNAATARAYELAGADVSRATPITALPEDAPLPPPGGRLKTYRAATRILAPVAPLVLSRRASKGKEDPARRNERMGRASRPRPDGELVWMHAASVGETNTILPLMSELRARRPSLRFLLTTGTLTSASVAKTRLSDADIHQYVPLDTPNFARRFLNHWHPDLAVFTESEVWPNLTLETSARKIPLAIVNARVSPRSFKRWRKNPSLSHPLFARFDLVLAQNEKLAENFRILGSRRVLATGNLKIDAPVPPVDAGSLNELITVLKERCGYLAASTHEGEEEILAAAHRLIARKAPDLCTIIVPRHPERGTGIAETLKAGGFKVSQRSLGQLPEASTEIYIADTLGELGTFYALSPISFIGGSLADKGGQNPIEAIRHGAAILTGPSRFNFQDVYDVLDRHGGLREVTTAQEIASSIDALLHDEAELDTMRTNARAALDTIAGAMKQTVDALLGLLPPPGSRLGHGDTGPVSTSASADRPSAQGGGDIRRAS